MNAGCIAQMRHHPAACQVGDWIPAYTVPLWGLNPTHIFEVNSPTHGPVSWAFVRARCDCGGERRIAWKRIS